MFARDVLHPHPSLQDKLAALYAMKGRSAAISDGLRPEYLSLLKAFGNPHQFLPPVVHVAGTNGKGSTIAFMKAIAQAAGLKAHVYTSPHLMQFNERIELCGTPISDADLEALVDEAIILNAGHPTTFFEITTAMAFAAFAKTEADLLFLETGLGGRLDCTNVIERPALTVISSIAYDHQEFLGYSVQAIAAEKAGIMKRSVPCVLGHQDYAVQKIFTDLSAHLAAPLYMDGRDWRIDKQSDCAVVYFGDEAYRLEEIGLKGTYQIHNAGLACAAMHVLRSKWLFTADDFRRGVAAARWPARLENVTRRSAMRLPAGWELWLDGAHNQSGGAALYDQFRQWATDDSTYGQSVKPVYVILGMMRHKDVQAFIMTFCAHAQNVQTVSIPDEPGAFTAQELTDILKPVVTAIPQPDVNAAIAECIRNNSPGRIIIAGSLYLAGHVLRDVLSQG